MPNNLALMPDPAHAPQPGVLPKLAADTFNEPMDDGMVLVTEESLREYARGFAYEAGLMRDRLLWQPSGWYQEQLGGPDYCTALQAFRIRAMAVEIACEKNPRQSSPMSWQADARVRHQAGLVSVAQLHAAAERRRVEVPREESLGRGLLGAMFLLLAVVLVALGLWLNHHWTEHPEARPGYTLHAPQPVGQPLAAHDGRTRTQGA